MEELSRQFLQPQVCAQKSSKQSQMTKHACWSLTFLHLLPPPPTPHPNILGFTPVRNTRGAIKPPQTTCILPSYLPSTVFKWSTCPVTSLWQSLQVVYLPSYLPLTVSWNGLLAQLLPFGSLFKWSTCPVTSLWQFLQMVYLPSHYPLIAFSKYNGLPAQSLPFDNLFKWSTCPVTSLWQSLQMIFRGFTLTLVLKEQKERIRINFSTHTNRTERVDQTVCNNSPCHAKQRRYFHCSRLW